MNPENPQQTSNPVGTSGQQAPAPYPTPSNAPNTQPPTNQEKNSLAAIALVLSLLGFLIFLFGIAGFVTGIIAYKKSRTLSGEGKGLSVAAIIIGFITGFLAILLIIVLLAIPALQKANGG